jgi:hypothetical protein
MTDELSSSPEFELSDDTLRALLRAYGSTPPYSSVDWEALALRVAQDAQHELERRQAATGTAPWNAMEGERGSLKLARSLQIDHGGRSRRRVSSRVVRRWWEVTAGWVRPVMIAAAVVIALATSLTVALPNIPAVTVASGDTSTTLSGSEYATEDRDAGDSAMEAAVVGRVSGQQYDLGLATPTRDQIFTEVVNER